MVETGIVSLHFPKGPCYPFSLPILWITLIVTTVLWITQHASSWQILLLCVAFFGFVWIAVLFLLARLSKSHSWILPVLACGLGAPRWAQIWWGTSGSGLYLPWAGSYASGALVSRSLWLWLGVLDALQGLGFGMILLQTLTRMHICFTLLVSQVLGSLATICARAFAPNNIGPGPISPDITAGAGALGNAWFWVALLLQLSIWYVVLMRILPIPSDDSIQVVAFFFSSEGSNYRSREQMWICFVGSAQNGLVIRALRL